MCNIVKFIFIFDSKIKLFVKKDFFALYRYTIYITYIYFIVFYYVCKLMLLCKYIIMHHHRNRNWHSCTFFSLKQLFLCVARALLCINVAVFRVSVRA
jgi:hypothetical protein